MGTTIKAKFVGNCKICGADWAIGESIFYQKLPKAICSEKECFDEQGGKLDTRNSYQKKSEEIIVAKIPEIVASDSIKEIGEHHQMFFVTANALAKSYYPEQDVNSHVFGQIRSKILDQLIALSHLMRVQDE